MSTTDGVRPLYSSLSLPNDQNSIRLLYLQGSLDTTSSIVASLHNAHLNDRPSFEALSYCWGPTANGEEALINGEQLSITPNLASALRALRFQHKTRILWVDAICIDQNNVPEKNFQVQLMRRIYATCSRTIVWLGPGDVSSRKAFRFMQKASTQYGNLIKDVLRRPWFRRVWVIQEVAFAPEVEVQCGDDKVPWDVLARTCSHVSRSAMMVDPNAPKDAKHFHPTFYPKIMDATRQKITKGERFSALDAFRSFRTFEATNGLDKVYGLLGLVDDPGFVTVDYGKSVQEVFREVALTAMRTSNSVNILGDCLPREIPTREWQSWIPDWTDSGQTVSQDLEDLSGGEEVFGASCDTLAEVELGNDSSLRVSGQFIATVAEMAPPWKSIEELRNLLLRPGRIPLPRKRGYELTCYCADLYTAWQNVACRVNGDNGTLQDKYVSNESVLEAWYNTTYNTSPPFSNVKDARQFDQYVYSIELGLVAMRWWQHHIAEKLPWLLVWMVSGPFVMLVCLALMVLIVSGCVVLEPPTRPPTAFRSLWDIGRTDNGLIGMFPAPTFLAPTAISTRPGDAVVLLKGAAHPFVLRAEGKKWRVVGDAYVHGIMHGAAFDESKCVAIDLV